MPPTAEADAAPTAEPAVTAGALSQTWPAWAPAFPTTEVDDDSRRWAVATSQPRHPTAATADGPTPSLFQPMRACYAHDAAIGGAAPAYSPGAHSVVRDEAPLGAAAGPSAGGSATDRFKARMLEEGCRMDAHPSHVADVGLEQPLGTPCQERAVPRASSAPAGGRRADDDAEELERRELVLELRRLRAEARARDEATAGTAANAIRA